MLLFKQRDTAAARRFFIHALSYGPAPVEVTTDKAGPYLRVLDELGPAAAHVTEQYSNNRIEADHGRLKARLRPMPGRRSAGGGGGAGMTDEPGTPGNLSDAFGPAALSGLLTRRTAPAPAPAEPPDAAEPPGTGGPSTGGADSLEPWPALRNRDFVDLLARSSIPATGLRLIEALNAEPPPPAAPAVIALLDTAGENDLLAYYTRSRGSNRTATADPIPPAAAPGEQPDAVPVDEPARSAGTD